MATFLQICSSYTTFLHKRTNVQTRAHTDTRTNKHTQVHTSPQPRLNVFIREFHTTILHIYKAPVCTRLGKCQLRLETDCGYCMIMAISLKQKEKKTSLKSMCLYHFLLNASEKWSMAI